MVPLCVDLDGTLCRADTLRVCTLALLRRRPWLAPALPLWLMRGRASFKRRVTALSPVDPARLPWNEPFVEWLAENKAAGRQIFLVTAADRSVAEAVARHFGTLFDGVLASDGARNLKSHAKLEKLREQFPGGFDYAGNAAADLPIWRGARSAIVVSASARIARRARREARVAQQFP